MGVAPFEFGKQRDYWPEMDEQRIAIDKKTGYLLNRRDNQEEALARDKNERENQADLKMRKALAAGL